MIVKEKIKGHGKEIGMRCDDNCLTYQKLVL